MSTPSHSFRLLACALVIVLTVTFAAPARAEADVLTAIAIGSLIVAGIVLIAYLIIANVDDSRRAEQPRFVWVPCAACAAIPAGETASPTAPPPQTL
jgi:hypothetical protein